MVHSHEPRINDLVKILSPTIVYDLRPATGICKVRDEVVLAVDELELQITQNACSYNRVIEYNDNNYVLQESSYDDTCTWV